jgi:hypothetical protein
MGAGASSDNAMVGSANHIQATWVEEPALSLRLSARDAAQRKKISTRLRRPSASPKEHLEVKVGLKRP